MVTMMIIMMTTILNWNRKYPSVVVCGDRV